MASSLDAHPDQDGLCSVYSAQPSETNCSISESLAKEMIAVNELSDDAIEASNYSAPKSETNVTASEAFHPCPSMNQFNLSVYSAPKSEVNVTMKEKFEQCQDLANVVYSTYSLPPSETNITLRDVVFNQVHSVSEYSALPSETNVTMAEGFHQSHTLNQPEFATEYSMKEAHFYDNNAYVERLQLQLGIPDEKLIGIEGANRSLLKIIDSNECLLHLDTFELIPVDFGEIPSTNPSVESYLLHSAQPAHEI